MSLNLALFNALSALQTYSQAMNVTAQNISNVNTEGYSRKIVHLQAVTVNGEVAGVEIASITREVNDLMVQDLRGTTSVLGDARVRDEFYGRMQDLFGSLRSNSSTGAVDQRQIRSRRAGEGVGGQDRHDFAAGGAGREEKLQGACRRAAADHLGYRFAAPVVLLGIARA